MKKREKNKLMTVMMSFMFITIMSLVIMPLTANAQTAHTAHFGSDKDGWAHEGWSVISNKDELYGFCLYGGNGFLTADIVIDGILVVYSDCEVNLCLNGHKIIQTGDYNVISLNDGSKLNLYDESNNTGIITHISRTEGSALYMYEATFTMYGGRIADNICHGAGGAIYSENSTIVMNGGIISRNKAGAHGGAIYAEKSDVTINQGNVEKNSLVSGGSGGGLYVSEGTLTINGGNISQNFASYGAGIAVEDSTVTTINGGNISGNTSDNQGGGIYTCFSSLTINGGQFSGNYATEEGGGLYGMDTAILMNDGSFSENNANRGGGLYIRQYASEELFRIEGGDISDNKAELGDGVYVISEGLIVDGIVKDSIYCYLNTNDESNYYSVNFDPNKGTGKTYTQYYHVMFLEDPEDFDDYFKRYLVENRFTRSGYEFYNWNTEADGSGTSYVDGAEIKTEDSCLTLYAQWIPNKYTVKYNANGGSGTMSSQSVKSNSSITLNANTFTRQGYEFAGWNTKANGSGTSYADGENTEIIVLNTNKITLYAQWKASTDTPYKVEHYKQKLDGTYNKKASEAYELTGTTDTSVTPEVKTYKGFTSPVTKTEKIKADGSLVIKYYYERNSYTLTWNLAGGTADGAYSSGMLKYQEKITAPVPTKLGYEFNGWSVEVPSKMPAKNLTIKATWKAATDTKYTVEHYKQKLDGTYTAKPSETDKLTGTTNTKVTPEVKTYEGFTSPATKTAKIKADGTLVVQYYYE
ncbi:MAG: InlB B-repeat-containing protein, partial [Lachnospiraceae bacterium]|nr:InlB B-repeat-containing protein [Lachnospiraceae bacterium]